MSYGISKRKEIVSDQVSRQLPERYGVGRAKELTSDQQWLIREYEKTHLQQIEHELEFKRKTSHLGWRYVVVACTALIFTAFVCGWVMVTKLDTQAQISIGRSRPLK